MLVLLLFPANRLGAGPLFESSFYSFACGPNPLSVRLVDVDGDDVLDILTANEGGEGAGSTTLSFLRGRGDGSFDPSIEISTGQNPASVVLADVSGDGIDDLVATASFDAAVWVHRGTGGGAFGTTTQVGVGDNPGTCVVSDLNGDAFPDIAVSNYYPPAISLLFGLGGGVFGPAATLATPGYTTAVEAIDLDRNGIMDLVATNTGAELARDSILTVFEGLGGGSFAPPSPELAGLAPNVLAFGAFDSDTFPDVAVGCIGDSTLRILVNDGSGDLARVATYRLGDKPHGIAVGDLDGDTTDDLVVVLDWNGYRVFNGHGNGLFTPGHSGLAGFATTCVALGDVDGDGLLDLAAGNLLSSSFPATGAVSIARGNGDGTFGPGREYPSTTLSLSGVALADLDGDDFADAVAVDRFGQKLAVYLGDGAGHLAVDHVESIPIRPSALALLRLDGDAVPDLALTDGVAGGRLWLRPGIGDGTFGAGAFVPIGRSPRSIVPFDLNADAHDDLVLTRDTPDTIIVAYSDGLGGISSLWTFRAGFGLTASAAVGLIDSDAWPDLAIAGYNGLFVYWGIAGGMFTPSPARMLALDNWASVAVGDVDGDGHSDVVAVRLFERLAVYHGNGDRTFEPALNLRTSWAPKHVLIRDVTMDGRPDLLVANNNSNTVGVFPQRSDGSFGSGLEYGTGTFPVFLAVADFNGDPLPDIVSANGFPSASLSLLINTGDVSTPATWSLAECWAAPGEVHLTWIAPRAGERVRVERRDRTSEWAARSEGVADGLGRVNLVDREVESDREYGYRLVVPAGVGTRTFGESWIRVPGDVRAARLTIEPNPIRGAASLALELPGTGEAKLQVFDLSGRRVQEVRLGALPAGSHRIAWRQSSQLSSGTYYVRLIGPGYSTFGRAAVVR
jgi:hypothetical protein